MRKYNYIRWIFIMCIMLIYIFTKSYDGYAATNISIKAGQSQVAVGKTVSVSITVPDGAEAWTYKVSYSSDVLKLVSGDLTPMGFAGEDSRTNTIIFSGIKVGTATVSVSGVNGISMGGKDYDASGSISISVVAVSNPSGSKTSGGSSGSGSSGTSKVTPTPDTRSSNNSLASLTISEGTLSPAFDSSVTEYSVNLSSKTTSINVSATPSDTKATVKGTGDIAVQPGDNTISIEVTAENGTKKTYTINAYVDEAPLVYTEFEGRSLGVVRNLRNVTIPQGFTETTTTLEGQEVKAWTNETIGITLVYLVDEEENAAFYVYSPDKGVISKYVTFEFNGQNYTFAGIDESLREQDGLTYGKVEVLGNEIDGFTFNDENLSSFVVLYLMNENNEYGFYTYDTVNQTLQMYSGAVLSSEKAAAEKQALEQKLDKQILIRNICIGVAAALAVVVAVLLYKLNTESKRIRRLRRRRETVNIES